VSSSERTTARDLLGLVIHCARHALVRIVIRSLSRAITAAAFLLLSSRLLGDDGGQSTIGDRAVVEQLRAEATRPLSTRSPYLPEELRRSVRLAGERRLADSATDLVFLLDNTPELAAQDVIPALGKIGYERAVVTLVGQFRWQSGSGQVLEAIDALAELNRPVARTLVRALASKDDLTRRRASYDIALLGRSEIQSRILDRVSPAPAPALRAPVRREELPAAPSQRSGRSRAVRSTECLPTRSMDGCTTRSSGTST
jgi:hypothetical protein